MDTLTILPDSLKNTVIILKESGNIYFEISGYVIALLTALTVLWIDRKFRRQESIRDNFIESYGDRGISVLISYAEDINSTLKNFEDIDDLKDENFGGLRIGMYPQEAAIKVCSLYNSFSFLNLLGVVDFSCRDLIKIYNNYTDRYRKDAANVVEDGYFLIVRIEALKKTISMLLTQLPRMSLELTTSLDKIKTVRDYKAIMKNQDTYNKAFRDYSSELWKAINNPETATDLLKGKVGERYNRLHRPIA